MKTKFFTLIVITVLSVLFTACSPAAAEPQVMAEKTADTMMEKTPEEKMEKPTEEMVEKPKDAMMEKNPENQDSMMEVPAWLGFPLTEVTTGQTFTVNEYKGKVILVETMAIWCSSCKKQQNQVKELHTLLGERDDFVSLGLDIDPNENADSLKQYVADNGFDWKYAIAPVELSREFSELYGNQFLNPPSTPMLIVDRKGQAHPLPFGIKSAADLQKALEPFLSESM